MSSRKYLAALGVAVATFVAFGLRGAAADDDDSERARLVEQIDDKLGDVADKVSGARSDDGDDRIQEAESVASEVSRLVEQLDRVKGDDDRARRIVDRYPAYLRRFDAAARTLSVRK